VSVVSNALVSFSIMENSRVRMSEVNAKLAKLDEYRGQAFQCGDDGDWYGGNKVMESSLWGAAFNHVGLGWVARSLLAASWDRPESVQLFWEDQDDDTWTLYTLEDLKEYLGD